MGGGRIVEWQAPRIGDNWHRDSNSYSNTKIGNITATNVYRDGGGYYNPCWLLIDTKKLSNGWAFATDNVTSNTHWYWTLPYQIVATHGNIGQRSNSDNNFNIYSFDKMSIYSTSDESHFLKENIDLTDTPSDIISFEIYESQQIWLDTIHLSFHPRSNSSSTCSIGYFYLYRYC